MPPFLDSVSGIWTRFFITRGLGAKGHLFAKALKTVRLAAEAYPPALHNQW
jgi:hypothetical protein